MSSFPRVDAEITSLESLADELRTTLQGLSPSHALTTSLLEELDQIDRKLAEMKEAVSS